MRGLLKIIGAFFGLFVFFTLVALMGVYFWRAMLLEFPAYSSAKTYIIHHPVILEKLGVIETWDNFPQGSFRYNDKSGSGELILDLVGQKGVASITLKMSNELKRNWWVDSAVLTMISSREKITLDTSENYFDRAKAALKSKDIEIAKQQCHLIHLIAPNDYIAANCDAEIYYNTFKDEEYLKVYQELIQQDPNYYYFHFRLGQAYYDINRAPEALPHLQRAWSLKQTEKIANLIAAIYLNTKQADQAIFYLDEALRLGKMNALLAYNYGVYFDKKGDKSKAESYFLKSINLDPSYALPYFGMSYLKTGFNQIYYVEQGLARAPANSLKERLRIVELLVNMKDYDVAIYHALRAIDYHPENRDVYLWLKKLYELEGRAADVDWVLQTAHEKGIKI